MVLRFHIQEEGLFLSTIIDESVVTQALCCPAALGTITAVGLSNEYTADHAICVRMANRRDREVLKIGGV